MEQRPNKFFAMQGLRAALEVGVSDSVDLLLAVRTLA
jgi:hypothetical protein